MTISLLERVLDQEKPDLVVFTGDQLNGQSTSWDAKTVLAKFARAVTDRQIPWAAVFGNHDDEDGDSRTAQLRYMQALPYSLVQPGPKDIHGVGNYILKVYSADPYVPLIRICRCRSLHPSPDPRRSSSLFISSTLVRIRKGLGISLVCSGGQSMTGYTRCVPFIVESSFIAHSQLMLESNRLVP